MTRPTDTRERLLSTTIDLLHSGSYDSAGVQQVCDQAGVQKGSLYHFFESKQALALAAIDAEWAVFERDLLLVAYDPARPPLERITEHFRLAYRAQLRSKQEFGTVRGCFFGNLAQELATRNEPIRRSIDAKLRRVASCLRSTLAEARDEGELPADSDPQAGSEAILAYLQGLLLMSKSRNEPGFVKRHAAAALALVGAR